MSATDQSFSDAVEHCQPADADPVTVDATDLDSTAPEYLRDLKYEFAREGYVPARVTATACFDEDCSLATQAEADRLRELVRATSFLGAGRLVVSVESVAAAEKVRPALGATAERARREGISLEVLGPVDLPS